MSTRSDGSPPHTAELYVRSLAPRTGCDHVRRAVRRLDRLAADGTIDDVDVRVTGTAIPAGPGDCVTSVGTTLVRRLARFRDWAAQTGRELGPGFDRRTVHSTYTGGDYDAATMPALCLAEDGDGRLRFVSPCLEDGTSITVEERLAELERGRAGNRSDAVTATPGTVSGP